MSRKVSSRDVWLWPEFEAFAKRLGIPLERVVDLDISLHMGSAATFTAKQICTDISTQYETTSIESGYRTVTVTAYDSTTLDIDPNKPTGFVE